MPSYSSHSVLAIAWEIKMFLSLKVGVTRGKVTDAGTLGKRSREQTGSSNQKRNHEQKQIFRLKRSQAELASKTREAEQALEQLCKRDRRVACLENRLAGIAPAIWSGINNRSRGNSMLLVSFCNVRDENKPVLAAVDLCASEPQVRWIEPKEGKFLRGSTGMCFWNDLLCIAHQGGPGLPQGFVLLDPSSNFELVYEGLLPSSTGVHSVCSRDSSLYFVAARKDSVYRATLSERTGEWNCSLYWTLPESSGQQDENHLNAIECVEGDLYISGFGKKESGLHPGWRSTNEGFVYNIDRGEYVMESIYHPHSLLRDSGSLWSCESAEGKIRSSKGIEKSLTSGYIRGLAISEDRFYVGSSKRRKISESTGAANPRVPRELEGNCCIYTFSRDLSEPPEMLIDFSDIRNEIYEMVII